MQPQAVRLFLLVEGAAFILAALVHSGELIKGYEHRQAETAESAIGIVLLLALTLMRAKPAWGRTIAVAAQGFALFGTAVGMFTIAIGIGPRTVPDVAYHVTMVIVLLVGLAVAIGKKTAGAPSA